MGIIKLFLSMVLKASARQRIPPVLPLVYPADTAFSTFLHENNVSFRLTADCMKSFMCYMSAYRSAFECLAYLQSPSKNLGISMEEYWQRE